MGKGKKITILSMLVMTLVFSLIGSAGAKEAVSLKESNVKAKYVFYFIGDGLGTSQRQISEYYSKEITGDHHHKLVMNTFPNSAINTTHSLDTLITDSAAAGTALATGQKTNNGVISKDPQGHNLVTIMELAEKEGIATGIATTTRVTHATPAVFISHNESRSNENDIAYDMLDSGVDYIVGGGLRHFLPEGWVDRSLDGFGNKIKSKRKDDLNIFSEFQKKGYKVRYGLDGSEQFSKEVFEKDDKYMNLFTYSHLPYSLDDIYNEKYDTPTLAEMTAKGIELLSQNDKGFFFMIEGGRIDHACHPNDTKAAIMDTLAFDDAIAEAYKFYEKHKDETLIIVVGDHETGGLGLGINTNYFLNLSALDSVQSSLEELDGVYDGNREAYMAYVANSFGLTSLTKEELALLEKGMDYADEGSYTYSNKYKYDEAALAVTHIVSQRAGVYWTSYAHTATQIPLSAIGIGASSYNGFLDNTDIAKITAELLGLSLDD